MIIRLLLVIIMVSALGMCLSIKPAKADKLLECEAIDVVQYQDEYYMTYVNCMVKE